MRIRGRAIKEAIKPEPKTEYLESLAEFSQPKLQKVFDFLKIVPRLRSFQMMSIIQALVFAVEGNTLPYLEIFPNIFEILNMT